MKYGLLTYNCNSANKHAEKSEEKAVSERLEKLLWWWVSFAHFVLLSAEWFHYLTIRACAWAWISQVHCKAA